MTELPIIFQREMIPPIIDGRKTHTRRLVKLKNPDGYETVTDDGIEIVPWTANRIEKYVRCPYGNPGDLLWVRHTFYEMGRGTNNYQIWDEFTKTVRFPGGREAMDIQLQDPADWRKMPSIFLPKWAARLWLENKGVAVEKLQDITEDDAIAEGAQSMHLDNLGQTWKTHKRGFQSLWDSINGKGAWDSNPWVRAIKFEVKSVNGRKSLVKGP